MLPTSPVKGDVVVMIDQRKLPAAGSLRPLQDGARSRARDQDDGDSRRAGDWRRRRDGDRARHAPSTATGTQKFAAEFQKICDLMAATRPTAVNLFWAIDRMKRSFAAAAQAGESVDQIKERLDARSAAIHDEDVASCRAMGAFGAERRARRGARS